MWIDTLFSDFYVKLNKNIDWTKAVKEAELIRDMLQLTPDHEILDLPCGFGRIAIELTRMGFNVKGMEYSPVQIHYGKQIMEERDIRFPIEQADMRNIPAENRFDRAYCHFGSFGYFSDDENQKVLEEFYKALKPDGWFLLEGSNWDWIVKNYRSSDVHRLDDGRLFLEERKYDPFTARNHGIFTMIYPDASVESQSYDMRLYSVHELLAMFRKAGFEVAGVFDGNGKEFTMTSQRYNIIGKK